MPDTLKIPLPPTDSLEQGDVIMQFLTSRKTRIYRHLLGVSLLVVMTIGAKTNTGYATLADYLDYAAYLGAMLTLQYANMYVLMPREFYRRKYIRYVLLLALVISLLMTVLVLIHKPYSYTGGSAGPTTQPTSDFILATVIISMLPQLLVSSAIKLFQRWIADTNRLNKLENSALQSELKALRNQINPHFLFNMLNNIYVLIKKDADTAAHLTLKLSDFLRYLLYESNQATVFLSAELKFIDDFLLLEKMRRDNFGFTLTYSPPATKGVKIPSHVLITLVENALKHSVDSTNASQVTITVEVEAAVFRFVCSNTVPALKPAQPRQSGIGLANTTRRLELLYPQGYSMIINTFDNQYVVELTLPL